ncbi:unnamed protein product [Calypogeia fissa]
MASEAPQSPASSEAAMAAAVAERLLSAAPSTTEGGMGGAKKPLDQEPPPSSNTTSSFGLSLPLRENSKNQFNLAKARADAAAAVAAAAAGIAGSLSSTYRSRRQSGSSQVSYSSRASHRSGGGRPSKRRTKKLDVATGENVQVYDDTGKDVTPKPLVSLKPTVLAFEKISQATAGRLSGQGTPANIPADRSIQTCSRTGYSITSTAGSLTPETVEGDEADHDDGGMSVKSRSLMGTSVGIPDTPKIIHIMMAPVVMPATEKDKEKIVYVFLHESNSFELFNVKGANFNAAYECCARALERNAKYEALLKLKQGSDNYNHSYAQTLVLLLKNKELQASASSMQSEATQANAWDIYDTITGQKQSDIADPWTIAQGRRQAEQAAADAALVPTNMPKVYGSEEGPNMPTPTFSSPEPSRRPSTLEGDSRRGSQSGKISRRQSISGKVSRRGSTTSGQLSRRLSTTASLQVEDLFGKRPGVVGSSSGGDIQGGSDGVLTSRARVFDGDISKLTNLGKAIQVAERALVQNSYHNKLLAYKDYRPQEAPIIKVVQEEPPEEQEHQTKTPPPGQPAKKDSPPPPTPSPPPPLPPLQGPPVETNAGEANAVVSVSQTDPSDQEVKWLWDYTCDLTEGKNISCMCWNKVNKDLLTVGYGQFEFGAQKGGMVAFWSIKNPRYPLAMITCKSDVTAIDFSTSTPTLLAVGFYNGILAIYDSRNPKDMQPVVQSGMNTGRHEDPIWKVEWIDSSSEHGESLVSISTDGRVSQWFLKKDLEFVNLIKLKKISGSMKGEQAQPFISRRSAGMCFDFCPRDPGVYLVGSEEGLIYKCDRSYSEQYMATYVGHTGPVYQVRWNHTVPNFFLSCSSDWTVRFWREEQESALMVIQTVNESISDVQWSIKNSTVFATVSVDGRLEIWDMAISVMKPTIIHKVENSRLSCLMFAEELPVVLTGGSNGAVTVLRLDGFEKVESEAKQVKLFRDALALNINAHLS